MAMGELPLLLNCVECGAFQEWERVQENVVDCAECGKRHSDNSLHVADPDKSYERDEAGALLETPP